MCGSNHSILYRALHFTAVFKLSLSGAALEGAVLQCLETQHTKVHKRYTVDCNPTPTQETQHTLLCVATKSILIGVVVMCERAHTLYSNFIANTQRLATTQDAEQPPKIKP